MAPLAAAAPPVAAILALKQASDQINADARGAIQGAGNTAAAFANPDPSAAGSIRAVGEASRATSEKLGLLGVAANQAILSFADLMTAIDGTVNRYAEFSPNVAQAQAMAEIRQTMGDMRRAQTIGPELANYVRMQGELQQKFEDIKIKVLLKILPIVIFIGNLVEQAVNTGSAIAPAVLALVSPLAATAEMLLRIANQQEAANRPEPNDPTDLILNLNGVGPGGNPAPGAGLNTPNL